MFVLFKKNQKQKPNWSPFDTLEEHEKFEPLVSEYFEIAHHIDPNHQAPRQYLEKINEILNK